MLLYKKINDEKLKINNKLILSKNLFFSLFTKIVFLKIDTSNILQNLKKKRI